MRSVAVAPCIFLALICCTVGDYKFELELYNYDNPNGTCRCVLAPAAASCYDFVCCDNFNQKICTGPNDFPDVYFIACLRVFTSDVLNETRSINDTLNETRSTNDALNETQSISYTLNETRSISDTLRGTRSLNDTLSETRSIETRSIETRSFCASDRVTSTRERRWLSIGERVMTYYTIGNSKDIHFDTGYSALLGAPNPLLWVGRGAFPNEGLELIIEVWDYDGASSPDFDDLVDRYVLRVTNHNVIHDTFTGQYNVTTVNATLSAVCTDSFYGSDCGIICVERDDDQGHYTCDSEGNKVCRDGYWNPETNCTDIVHSSTPLSSSASQLSNSTAPLSSSTAVFMLAPFTPTLTASLPASSAASGMQVIEIDREFTPLRTRHPALIPPVVLSVVGLLAMVVLSIILVRIWLKRKKLLKSSRRKLCANVYYEPVKFDVHSETVSFRAPTADTCSCQIQDLPTVSVSYQDTTNTCTHKSKVLCFAVNPIFMEERGASPTQQECDSDINE